MHPDQALPVQHHLKSDSAGDQTRLPACLQTGLILLAEDPACNLCLHPGFLVIKFINGNPRNAAPASSAALAPTA